MPDTMTGAFKAAPIAQRPSRSEAEEAVRTLIRWAGDSPARQGLTETPARVVRAYEEWFAGYGAEPLDILSRTFSETAGYDETVLLRDIPVNSVCEHHMAPIHGVAHVAYLPGRCVVGISKLARLVEAYARRLQIQERLTAEIADAVMAGLAPRGVAVVVDAQHECMSGRGVRAHGASLVTRCFRGIFSEADARGEIMALIGA